MQQKLATLVEWVVPLGIVATIIIGTTWVLASG